MGSDLESELANTQAVSQESPHTKSKKKRKRENTEDILSQESPQTPNEKSKKKKKRVKERSYDGTIPIQNDKPLNKPNEQSPMDVKIEVTYCHSEKTPPIVGYFPSGYKPCKYNVSNNSQEPNQEQNLSQPQPQPQQPIVKLYRNAQRTKIEKRSNENTDKWKSSERMELVVSPNGYNLDFVGKSYRGEAMAAQFCTYALGVFDKKTKTLKIMPVAGNKIFRLEPKVRGLDTADEEPSVLENEEVSGGNNAEKIMAAGYVTKKSVMQYKKAQALKQGDDPESQRDLGRKIDNVVVNKEALESASAHVARNIPPHNSSATTPQEAYPLNRIILTGEWDFLEDTYKFLQEGAGAMSNAYPTFVRNRIHKLREIQDEVEKQTLSCIFSYITHLIKFKDLHSLDGLSSAKSHRFPSILRQKFMEMFTPESKRLPSEKIDLLISYVLVLTLYADDFRTNPTDIAKDLRFSPVNLRVHFENLGCKLVRENKLLLATLPVPLKFPTQRQRRRR